MPQPEFVELGGGVELRVGDRTLGLLRDGAALAEVDAPRPFWHPLHALDGRELSEDAPADHPWHHGLSIAVANVAIAGRPAAANLWGGPTFADGEYRDLGNAGRQRVLSTEVLDGVLRQELDWRAPDGATFLAESRETEARMLDDGWRLEVRSRWRNGGAHPVVFGSPTTAGRENAGYGGFFLRGSRALLGAAVRIDDVPVDAEAAMGRVGSSCRLDAGGLSVTMTAADPTPWFVRVEPVVMLCAAPFFDEEFELAPGAEVAWAWALELG